eukprot:365603-Chlamydomonas_euryale.AAC.4
MGISRGRVWPRSGAESGLQLGWRMEAHNQRGRDTWSTRPPIPSTPTAPGHPYPPYLEHHATHNPATPGIRTPRRRPPDTLLARARHQRPRCPHRPRAPRARARRRRAAARSWAGQAARTRRRWHAAWTSRPTLTLHKGERGRAAAAQRACAWRQCSVNLAVA